MHAGEPQYQPPAGGHERVAVDVTTELLALRVLSSLVFDRDLPLGIAEVGMSDDPAPPVVDRHLHFRVGQVTTDQCEAEEALRTGGRVRVRMPASSLAHTIPRAPPARARRDL